MATAPSFLACPLLDPHGATENVAVVTSEPIADASVVDVVLHFHGYARKGTFSFARKVERSGLRFERPSTGGALRRRPTIGIVPLGRPRPPQPNGLEPRDFPQLTTQAHIDALVAFVLTKLAPDRAPPVIARRIVTAHSGGGAAIQKLTIDPAFAVDEVHIFDGLYFTAQLGSFAAWAIASMITENRRLADEGADHERLRSEGKSIRIICTDGGGTRKNSTDLDIALRRAIEPAGVLASLQRRFTRCDLADPAIGHDEVPSEFGWQLLDDAGAALHGASPLTKEPLPMVVPANVDLDANDETRAKQLDIVLRAVADALDGAATKDDALRLMRHIVWHESAHCTTRNQAAGPARGLPHFEAHRARDTLAYAFSRKAERDYWNVLVDAANGTMPLITSANLEAGFKALPKYGDPHAAEFPENNLIAERLIHNDFFGAALMRVAFKKLPEALPTSLEQDADFWKKEWKRADVDDEERARFVASSMAVDALLEPEARPNLAS